MSSWPQTRYSLLARLAKADAEAWQEFERVYQGAIYRYARSRGLQQADAYEAVQEVMLAVHRAMGRWAPSHRTGSFRAWLAETARRVTLQTIRQRDKADRAVGESQSAAAVESISASVEPDAELADERRWEFFCAAARVEREVLPWTWQAFWLTAVEGRTAEAVAQQLGLTVGNVYSAKCRVLARIRRAVRDNQEAAP